MNVEQLIAQAVAAQDRARQSRSYNVIGRLYTLECEKTRLQFDRHTGPGVAQEVDQNGDSTGQLLFLGVWGKLPPIQEYSEDFCKACLAKCDICDGKGKALCIFVGCGGRGRVPNGQDLCPGCAAKSGKFDPDCKVCAGHGAIPRFADCPSCKGTGQAPCGPCRGTGKRPTGRTKDGKAMCSSCNGSQRDGKFREQDLSHVINGRLDNYLVIGPVIKLILSPVTLGEVDRFTTRWEPGDPKPGTSFVRITPAKDKTGQPMLILIPMDPRQMVAPYFFGGSIL